MLLVLCERATRIDPRPMWLLPPATDALGPHLQLHATPTPLDSSHPLSVQFHSALSSDRAVCIVHIYCILGASKSSVLSDLQHIIQSPCNTSPPIMTPPLHYCYECSSEMRPLMAPMPKCPRCGSECVEEVSHPMGDGDD